MIPTYRTSIVLQRKTVRVCVNGGTSDERVAVVNGLLGAWPAPEPMPLFRAKGNDVYVKIWDTHIHVYGALPTAIFPSDVGFAELAAEVFRQACASVCTRAYA